MAVEKDPKNESLSVRKAIRLLRLITVNPDGMALKDLAEQAGLSKSVCHRLASTLVTERFLAQDLQSSRYRLGPDLLALAASGLGRSSLRHAAQEELVALADATGDVALLHTLDQGRALCLDRRDGDYPVRTAGVQVGGHLPLHCGGGPFALLSFAPPSVVESVLAQALPERTPRTLTDPARIRRRMAEVRARGYSVGDQDAFEYVVAVGAPIFDGSGALVGALSVGGIKPRYAASRIAEVGARVREAAARVSEKLGAAPRAA